MYELSHLKTLYINKNKIKKIAPEFHIMKELQNFAFDWLTYTFPPLPAVYNSGAINSNENMIEY